MPGSPAPGNGVGAPQRLAGVEVGRLDEAADAEFAAGGADDGDVADDQRRNGENLGVCGVGDLALPHDFAGRLVDGEHAAVEGDRDDLVLPQGDAAVVDAAAGDVASPGSISAGIHLPLDGALLAAGDVDRIDRAPTVRHIDDAVFHDGGRLEIAVGVTAAALEPAQRYCERGLEVLDGVGVDLLERGEAVALVVAVMQNPVLRFLLRIERALGRHVGGADRRQRGGHQQRTGEGTGDGSCPHGGFSLWRRASFPAWTSCSKASPASAKPHVSRTLGGACWGVNCNFMQQARADMRHRQHRPNDMVAERAVGNQWAALGRCRAVFSSGRHRAVQRWQEVRSFSSMEKISPASTLMLRTRQVRPEVSLRVAS